MAENVDKYELILLSSRKLIEEIGFSALTMDKVAQKAGIAKGTVYLYFKDKNELLEKVLEQGFERMFERIKSKVNTQKGHVEKLRVLIAENINHIYENRYFFKTVFLDEVNVVFLKKKSQESFNLRRKRYTDFIGEIIKSGIESGEFRHDLNSTKVGYMLVSLIKTNAIYNFLDNKPEFTEEMIKSDSEEIFNLLIYGISKH
ncbi:MAG: TetR/AcrR family transcriptional regulator [Candidatus Acidulodesulfobacterium ferriphilum]|uniref:TetR/AcrR family transcriptional regulator n=1 Tax=Candidatus Acidulodesulfobacterium ferriphilum TaxID=2597223 RepID=A0A519B9Q9_9DELT|nr:MAG: TetR/AcrR family transcriptional regulator [Candidatus Acidulodesulfobacterium ferriphilum]